MENNIAEKLVNLRKMSGETQMEVAEACGITHVALGRYENGTRIPRAAILSKLADHFDVSVDSLMGKENKNDPTTDEAWHIRERLRRDPDYKILFDAAGKATPEHLRAAAAMLKALEGDN